MEMDQLTEEDAYINRYQALRRTWLAAVLRSCLVNSTRKGTTWQEPQLAPSASQNLGSISPKISFFCHLGGLAASVFSLALGVNRIKSLEDPALRLPRGRGTLLSDGYLHAAEIEVFFGSYPYSRGALSLGTDPVRLIAGDLVRSIDGKDDDF